MHNIVILKSPFKIPKAFLTPCKVGGTNRYAESVRRVDSNGDLILSRDDKDSGGYFVAETDVIEIWDGKVFNLDDEVELAQWDAIKHHKIIAKARDERDDKGNLIIDGDARKYGSADWYVEIPGLEAMNKNKSRRKKLDAQNYVLNDSPAERRLKAQVLGKSMRNAHESDVEDYLMSECEKHPDKIINLYTGGDMQLRLLFLKLRESRIISQVDKLWLYNEIILGSTEESVIIWMKQPQNKKILSILQQEAYPEDFEQKKK